MISTIRKVFRQQFGIEPKLFRSPGRVNLIGEHTDYNEGFVLPAAVNKSIVIGIAPRNDTRCRIYAADVQEGYECRVDALSRSGKRWPNYLLGVVDQLRNAGFDVGGFDCAFGGDIPIGAGMSSSAAIEAGIAYALNDLFELDVDTLTLVKFAQKAENEFVGVRCGIMDQFINLYGKEQCVVRLDCRSLEFEYVPFEHENVRIVLCDTQVKRELASSEYNVRRQQCETGVQLLQRYDGNIRSLRDVTLELLGEHASELDPVVYKRCNYVIHENDRVLAACDDLLRDDVASFGGRMFESHAGLRDDYEVSCTELDVLVDAAMSAPGVLGSRMMGAGFGGCTITLVEETRIDEFVEAARRLYHTKIGRDIKVYITSIESGTTKVTEENVSV